MFVSDLLLIPKLAELGWPSFYLGTPVVYASYLLYVLLGRLVNRRENFPLVLGGMALLGSVQFFLVTNFAAWLGNLDGRYSRDLQGLLTCYAAGLPFFQGTVLSDLVGSAMIFGGHEILVRALSAGRAEAGKKASVAG